MNTKELLVTPEQSRRSTWVVATAFIVTMLMLATMTTAFADTTDSIASVEGGIYKASEMVYNLVTSVVPPIALCTFVLCGLSAFFGGERGLESAKKQMVKILVTMGIIYLSPVILNEVLGWVEGSSADLIFKRPR